MKTTVTFEELYKLVKSGVKPKVFTQTGRETVTDVYKKNSPGKTLTLKSLYKRCVNSRALSTFSHI